MQQYTILGLRNVYTAQAREKLLKKRMLLYVYKGTHKKNNLLATCSDSHDA